MKNLGKAILWGTIFGLGSNEHAPWKEAFADGLGYGAVCLLVFFVYDFFFAGRANVSGEVAS